MSEEISMSEEIYAKPDLTKKVRLQTSADRNSDATGDDARIYDNYCPKEGPSTKSQEDTTDQQQTSSVNVSSGKKSLLRATAAFVVLAIILAVLIVLVVLLTADQERNQLRVNVARLVSERNELQTNYSDLASINYNLTELTSLLEDEKELLEGMNNNLTMERDQLQTDYNEVKNLSQSLRQANARLVNENGRLTTERNELKAQIEATRCPTSWRKFENSCYFISREWKKWTDSRKICKDHGANLVIISNIMEQAFISSLNVRVWIGLTDEETENSWKWVNGEAATTTYWRENQPDNYRSGEDCAEIVNSPPPIKNWNDRPCMDLLMFICEKSLQ
ncbi:uncharacterized protein V6R79_022840 [Siganus canaliculatus]